MKNKIYVSTVAFGSSVQKAIRVGRKFGFGIEFSSALPSDPAIRRLFEDAELPRLPHNYFPAPKNPFVLNLASQDDSLKARSIKHCIQGLHLAEQSGSPFYAAHAGFCIDPEPSELGHSIEIETTYDRERRLDAFHDSVLQVAEEAKKLGVDFLIENNVVIAENTTNRKRYPLLCSAPSEIHSVLSSIGHPRVGLLLDTGHLKVSARTLGFDLKEAIEEVRPYVRGIHHSDNDGTRDSNRGITESYWFMPFIGEFRGIPHVLEVEDQSIGSVLRQIELVTSALTNK